MAGLYIRPACIYAMRFRIGSGQNAFYEMMVFVFLFYGIVIFFEDGFIFQKITFSGAY